MEYTLRPADVQDAAFLRELEAEAMRDHALALWGRYLPVEYPTLFDLEKTRIVSVAGVPAGNLTVESGPDHLRLRKLYLVPDVQGRGLGKLLLGVAQREAAAAGLPLRLSVLRPNRRALAFYLREGLQVTEDTGERLFLMQPVPAESRKTPL
ncbi:GNAT family N-acetyltransferase [Paragemmobacter aquarius]|uniref:GNAT family N-acetyltransferase n=1 Tax=Paragemmobacter aquarius TaxID=2169400 RepID=UPI001C1F828D|nr:GNAT family N-acetyltransferase [Gemmobacter aquarius]